MKGLLTSILTVLTFTGLQAQPLPSTPKLVVGLTIDQLRTDYLEAFSTLYGDRGFRRLWKEGRVFRNAEYTFSGTDRASAIAAIYTGTTPSVNGIIGKRWMDVSTLRTVSCVDDPAFMGNYTNESSSPSHLLTSTIGICHRSIPRRCHSCSRTCRKWRILAQQHNRKMVWNDLL